MRFHRDQLLRLLCAPPGAEKEVTKFTDFLDSGLNPPSPWKHLGLAQPEPILTIRSSLYTIVFEDVVGGWTELHDLGAQTLFSLVVMQAKDGDLLANVGPAAVDHMLVTLTGDEYRGRVDFQIMGEMRTLQAKPSTPGG